MSSQDQKTKPEIHVLLVAFSAQGHINPLLRLGKSLLTKGLKVTLATTELVYHRVFKSTTTPTTTAIPTSYTTNGIDVLFFSDGLDITDEGHVSLNVSVDEFMNLIAKFGPISLTNLIINNFLNNSSKKLACIINNPFVPWVTNIASELNIPSACLWIQPCSLYSIYYRFYNNLNHFPTLENSELDVEIPGLPLLKPQDLPSFILPTNDIQTISDVLQETFQNMKKQKWVLANSFYELEKNVIDSMAEIFPITTVGPLVPPSLLGQDQNKDVGIEMWKPQDSCMEWLNQKPPSSVIYISFGSLIFLTEKQMLSIAKALKNSNKYFLWAMKDEEGDEVHLPEKFIEETKEKGMIVTWCPQTRVLVHPAIACFLTHCGWNSTLEAITAGVPMIGYPQWTDQPTNAKLVSDVFRIGIRLKPDSDGFVESEEVERAIEEIVGGEKFEEFKKNVLELKSAAREAMADGGSSDRNIQTFVDEILVSAENNN